MVSIFNVELLEDAANQVRIVWSGAYPQKREQILAITESLHQQLLRTHSCSNITQIILQEGVANTLVTLMSHTK
jgi:hypothetical protein